MIVFTINDDRWYYSKIKPKKIEIGNTYLFDLKPSNVITVQGKMLKGQRFFVLGKVELIRDKYVFITPKNASEIYRPFKELKQLTIKEVG